MIPPFDKKVIEKLNLEGFSPDEQKEIIDTIEDTIRTSLLLEILNRLPETDRTELTSISMQGEGANEKCRNFLEMKIPNFADLITKTSLSVIGEFNALRG